MTTRAKTVVDATQAQAVAVVNTLTNTLRAMGWDFAAVSVSRAVQLEDGTVTLPGSSTFAATPLIMPSLPSLADSLRVLACELDAHYAASGCTTRADGYTHVLDSAAVQRRKREAEHG